jgi:hypothetical protein
MRIGTQTRTRQATIRSGRGVLVFFAVVLLTPACFQNKDAYFVNSCDVSLEIKTSDISIPTSPPFAKATLAPLSVTKVEDAFTTAGGFHWSVTVAGTSGVIQVDGNTWVHDTVVIPASVCAEKPLQAGDVK